MYNEDMKSIVVSAMRPTGNIHLGNYLGALSKWIELQDSGQYDCYFFAADYHALTTGSIDRDLHLHTQNMIADFISAGLKSADSHIFIQSQVPQHAELSLLLSNIVNLGRLQRIPTYKDLEGKIDNYGFLGYPVLQSADILLYNASFVPVGEDQAAHLEITREIAEKFNRIYSRKVFNIPSTILSKYPKIPGLDGRKMSKSYGNTIELRDSAQVVEVKIKNMITDPNRKRLSDKGNPEVCPVFSLHKAVSSVEIQSKVADGCRNATMGCIECKKLLSKSINERLGPIRERRSKIEENFSFLKDTIYQNTLRAIGKASETMENVKEAIGMRH